MKIASTNTLCLFDHELVLPSCLIETKFSKQTQLHTIFDGRPIVPSASSKEDTAELGLGILQGEILVP